MSNDMDGSPPQGRQSRRVRVVTLINRAVPHAGAEGLAMAIAMRLDPQRFESTLCVSRWPPSPPSDTTMLQVLEELSASGVTLLGLGRRRKVDIWVWLRLARFLRRERVDILHAHMFGSNLWATLIGRTVGVPVIIAHEHTWSYEGQPLRRMLDRHVIARGADRFVAVSREDQRRMTTVEHIPPDRTAFIPIGIRRERTESSSGRDIRAELGIPPDVPLLGTVGWLRLQKAHHVLVRAAALLRDEYPDIQVLIVGDGPERDATQGLINELNLNETVRILGARTDVPDILHTLDIAVSSSDFEGSPAAVLEYMGAELPVVATAVGGVPDLIESGIHGLLIPPGDPAALANAVSKLLRDPERARAMGDNGRKRQTTEFTMDAMIHRFEALYLELLALHNIKLNNDNGR